MSVVATAGRSNKNKAHLRFLPLLVGCVGGLIVGGLMMLAAWEHNPQGVIYNGNEIDWGYWLLIGISWLLPVFVVLAVASYLAVRLAKSL